MSETKKINTQLLLKAEALKAKASGKQAVIDSGLIADVTSVAKEPKVVAVKKVQTVTPNTNLPEGLKDYAKILSMSSNKLDNGLTTVIVKYRNTGKAIGEGSPNNEKITKNALSSSSVNSLRVSNVHLVTAIYEVLGVTDYRQVVIGRSWTLLTANSLVVDQTTEDFKILKALGINYNHDLRTAGFVPETADIEALKQFDTDKVQTVYNNLVRGMCKSHLLNAHNDQFNIASYQSKSTLGELNKIIEMI